MWCSPMSGETGASIDSESFDSEIEVNSDLHSCSESIGPIEHVQKSWSLYADQPSWPSDNLSAEQIHCLELQVERPSEWFEEISGAVDYWWGRCQNSKCALGHSRAAMNVREFGTWFYRHGGKVELPGSPEVPFIDA